MKISDNDKIWYEELVDDAVKKLPLDSKWEIKDTINALGKIAIPEKKHEMRYTTLEEKIIKPIQELIDNPDMYVQDPANFEEFKEIIRQRVDYQINELVDKILDKDFLERAQNKQRDKLEKDDKARKEFKTKAEKAKSRLESPDETHKRLLSLIDKKYLPDLSYQELKLQHPNLDRILDPLVTDLILKKQLSFANARLLGIDGLDYLKKFITKQLPDETLKRFGGEQIYKWSPEKFLTFLYAINEFVKLGDIDKSFTSDKDFMISLLSFDVVKSSLGYAAESLRDDEEVVSAAVKRSWDGLKYASDRLKKNEDLVRLAIEKYGGELEYADESLQKKKDLVLIAVKNGLSYKFIHKSLLGDKDVILQVVQSYPLNLEDVDPKFQDNRDIALAAVTADNRKFGASYRDGVLQTPMQFVSDRLKKDKDLVYAAVQNDKYNFRFADITLRNDPEIALVAITKDISMYKYVGEELKKDPSFIRIFEGIKKAKKEQMMIKEE